LGLGNGFIDWNKEIKPGPLELGFDVSFIVPATLDRVPCVFVDGHHVANLEPNDPIKVDYTKKIGEYPTGIDDPELLKYKGDLQHSNTIINGISRIGYMSGGHSALWKDEDMAMVLLNKAGKFITDDKLKPFFLYFSLTDIHVPRAPNKMFEGSSPMGIRGNNIVQMDWTVGQLMNILKEQNLLDNTLIIFTSDNGPVLDDGYDDKAEELVGEHKPSGPFNGGKYSSFEGGTRVPTLVYWKGHTKKGTSNVMLNQVDLFASLAALVGRKIDKGAAPDSENALDAWLGKSYKGRQVMIEEGFSLSLRDGEWKYIAPQTGKSPDWLKNKKISTGLSSEPQLYNLKVDVGEKKNVLQANRDRAQKMREQLEQIVQAKQY
jgi:arylsulfatase A